MGSGNLTKLPPQGRVMREQAPNQKEAGKAVRNSKKHPMGHRRRSVAQADPNGSGNHSERRKQVRAMRKQAPNRTQGRATRTAQEQPTGHRQRNAAKADPKSSGNRSKPATSGRAMREQAPNQKQAVRTVRNFTGTSDCPLLEEGCQGRSE